MTGEEEEHDAGLSQSLKLMLFGGLLMLACIVGANKLLMFHLSQGGGMQGPPHTFLLPANNRAFGIYSTTELYITWGLFILFALGLITVIRRLVNTWNQ